MKQLEHWKGETINGYRFVVAAKDRDIQSLRRKNPGAMVCSLAESRRIKHLGRQDAELALVAREIFNGEIE
jgi:hypothetical protein